MKLPPNTCPDINKIRDTIKSTIGVLGEYSYAYDALDWEQHYLEVALDILEEIRDANSQLRKYAEKRDQEIEELNEQINELQNELT